MKLEIYTDASLNNDFNTVVYGYIALINKIMHRKELFHNSSADKSINYYEICAIEKALENVVNFSGKTTSVDIYSDAKFAIDKLNSNNKKEKYRNILSHKKILNERNIEVAFNYVKAHSDNEFNNKIDKCCRTLLREKIRNRNKKIINAA